MHGSSYCFKIGFGQRVQQVEKLFLTAAVALLGISLAHAQADVLIEIDTGRTEGLFTKTPVFQRAILTKPGRPTETALLFFRGGSGNSAQIRSVADKQRSLNFMRSNHHLFLEEGIALVIVACPTDQWEASGRPPNANSCWASISRITSLTSRR